MATRFDLVTFDAPQPDRLARFWTEALGLHEIEREDGDRWLVLADTTGARRIGIQRGEGRPGSIHLDLVCEPHEFEAEVERLVSLGASLVRPSRTEPWGSIANLTDSDGNPFDLCTYA